MVKIARLRGRTPLLVAKENGLTRITFHEKTISLIRIDIVWAICIYSKKWNCSRNLKGQALGYGVLNPLHYLNRDSSRVSRWLLEFKEQYRKSEKIRLEVMQAEKLAFAIENAKTQG